MVSKRRSTSGCAPPPLEPLVAVTEMKIKVLHFDLLMIPLVVRELCHGKANVQRRTDGRTKRPLYVLCSRSIKTCLLTQFISIAVMAITSAWFGCTSLTFYITTWKVSCIAPFSLPQTFSMSISGWPIW